MGIALGINLSHDTSACLIKDGKIYAAEEERWTKIKHNSKFDEGYIFPYNSLKYVLDESATSIEDIDLTICVTTSEEDILGEGIKERKELICFKNVKYISHHKAHILSGFLLSPYERAVGLCIDGGGSLLGFDINSIERTTAYYCDNDNTSRIYSNWDKKIVSDNKVKNISCSLGLFYLNFAIRCIPKGDEPEGTMMALAAFGDDKNNAYYDEIKSLITLHSNGKYEITEPYGSNTRLSYSFGGYKWRLFNKKEDIPFVERANMAFAVQKVFEETVIHILNHLYKITNIPNLIFSGGCALNSKLNGTIISNTPFKNVYIPPAPHDGGTAIGAALYAWNYLMHERRINSPSSVNWGPLLEDLDDKDINNLVSKRFKCCKINDDTELYDKVSSMINDGKVLIWARGRMEFGPRALGNRSIIAKANDKSIRDRINNIKKRAWYRPLAPSVIDISFQEYFTGDADCYMNKVANLIDANILQAVAHYDNTARVQIVKKDSDFYPLLRNMLNKNMNPVIINTSLNLKGIPIARSKEDVINAFITLDVDAAVIGNCIISKP